MHKVVSIPASLVNHQFHSWILVQPVASIEVGSLFLCLLKSLSAKLSSSYANSYSFRSQSEPRFPVIPIAWSSR